MPLDAQWRTMEALSIKMSRIIMQYVTPLYAMSQMDKLLSAFVWENNQ